MKIDYSKVLFVRKSLQYNSRMYTIIEVTMTRRFAVEETLMGYCVDYTYSVESDVMSEVFDKKISNTIMNNKEANFIS